jgi:fatty-acyl-CoA synthase
VRGPWITGSYYRDDDPAKFHDGWLRTGDVASVYPNGFVMISDRAKDVIKSGGGGGVVGRSREHAEGHPAVLEGRGHRSAGRTVGRTADGVRRGARRGLDERGRAQGRGSPSGPAKWWVPERWSFIDEVPKTSVGPKFDKKVLRARHLDGKLDVETLS